MTTEVAFMGVKVEARVAAALMQLIEQDPAVRLTVFDLVTDKPQLDSLTAKLLVVQSQCQQTGASR
jgi:hypothetical protein